MRKITIVALMCLVMVLVSGCKNDTKLQLAVESANSECPISMGPIGECESIIYENGVVVYTLAVNEQFMNITAMKEHPDMLKQVAMTNYTNPEGGLKTLRDLVLEANAAIRYVYKGKDSGETFDVLLTAEDLKAAANNVNITAEDKLNAEIEATNMQFPMQVDEVTVCKKLIVESNSVVYLFQVDESMTSFNDFKNNADVFKEVLASNMKNGGLAAQGFIEKVKAAGMSLKYRYIGSESGDIVEIVFSVSDLKNM